jgi:NADPH:quinone reductase-like Zn-dependent oxidoreductase
MIRRADMAGHCSRPRRVWGVGDAAVQILDAQGIDAVATSRSEPNCRRLRDLGAGTAVVETATGLANAVNDGGRRPAAALVHLGGKRVAASLEAVGRGGDGRRLWPDFGRCDDS